MKALIILCLISFSSFASDRSSCQYDAEISNIEKLNTLNMINEAHAGDGSDNFTYLATLKLTNGGSPTGSRSSCDDTPKSIQVTLEESSKTKYHIGKKFRVKSGSGSDRGGYIYSYVKEAK